MVVPGCPCDCVVLGANTAGRIVVAVVCPPWQYVRTCIMVELCVANVVMRILSCCNATPNKKKKKKNII